VLFWSANRGWWGCWFHPNSAAGIYAASLGDVRLVPTQLLLASGNLAVSILAVFLRASMQAPGTKCCVMMFLYAGLRTIVAVWRAPHFFVGEQTDIGQDQIVWIAIGAGSIVLMIFMRDRNGIKSV
jgi:prolipoprotein diacylglyceryltransferase